MMFGTRCGPFMGTETGNMTWQPPGVTSKCYIEGNMENSGWFPTIRRPVFPVPIIRTIVSVVLGSPYLGNPVKVRRSHRKAGIIANIPQKP